VAKREDARLGVYVPPIFGMCVEPSVDAALDTLFTGRPVHREGATQRHARKVIRLSLRITFD
jgi:hypothetical protein